MQLIGLSGSVGVGKDSVAEYLVAEKGFLAFSFSDALYEEVAFAFGVSVEFLKHRDTKESRSPLLHPDDCADQAFLHAVEAAARGGAGLHADVWSWGFSPREVTQLWGTAYRRAQDPNYWVKRAEEVVEAFYASCALFDRDGNIKGYVDKPGLVNTSVRFPNERAMFTKHGGEVWHIYRPGHYSGPNEAYVSELTLPIETGDRILVNNSTLERLGTATDLMLRGNYVVASQTDEDYAFVPVFVPRYGDIVHNTRLAASELAFVGGKLGEI